MDARSQLLEVLSGHAPGDDEEARDLARMSEHARSLGEPFSRSQLPAHFTASAVIVGPHGDRVCFIHHKKLGRWLQPGGHVEPADAGSIARAALREAREETGLDVALHPRCRALLDVDIHTIPARREFPEHEHLDVRFLLVADSVGLRHDPEESLGVGWFEWDRALHLASDAALARLLRKARRLTEAYPIRALRCDGV